MQLVMVGARMCQPRALALAAILACSTLCRADGTADGLIGDFGSVVFNSGTEIEPQIADIGAFS